MGLTAKAKADAKKAEARLAAAKVQATVAENLKANVMKAKEDYEKASAAAKVADRDAEKAEDEALEEEEEDAKELGLQPPAPVQVSQAAPDEPSPEAFQAAKVAERAETKVQKKIAKVELTKQKAIREGPEKNREEKIKKLEEKV